MNRNDLIRYKKLLTEAKQLEALIDRWPEGQITDYAKDYRTGYPKIINIVGEADCQHLKDQLKKTSAELKNLLTEIVRWIDSIDDSDIRTIFRMKYIEGMTYQEIGENLGYTAESVRSKVKRFWDSIEK